MASIERRELKRRDSRGRRQFAYVVHYRDRSRSPQTKTFRRSSEAEAFAHDVGHRGRTGALPDARGGRQTLRELYQEVDRERKYAPKTVALHEALWRRGREGG